MGFFSKLFGQSNNDKIETHQLKNAAPPDFEFYEKLVDSIAVSEPLKADLKLKLKLSFDHPKAYYNNENEFILSERGLTYPESVSLTSKFVLVDTLLESNQMMEVDWKEEEEEVRYAVNKILETKAFNISISEECKNDEDDTLEILQLINSVELKPLGYALQILDIDSDSYVFTIVPLSLQAEVEAMFARLK